MKMASMVIFENFRLNNSRFFQNKHTLTNDLYHSILIRLHAYNRTISDLLHGQNISMKNYRNWLSWKQSEYMVIIK